MIITFVICNFTYMKVETNNLWTVGRYARHIEKSTSHVYWMIRNGKVAYQLIDGVRFIVVEENNKS